MPDLRQKIVEFVAHEETPVDIVIQGNSIESVFVEIDRTLRVGEPDAIIHALGFVRDAALYEHPCRDKFRQELGESTIWKRIESLLYFGNFWVRKGAIYTVGKLSYADRAPLLLNSFSYYLQNDPINLPGLLLELHWLTNQWNWDLLQQTAGAAHRLQRWSLCSILDDGGHGPGTAERFIQILLPLSGDSDQLVAAEAAFRLERMKIKLAPKLPKPEWRKQVRRIAQLEPKMTFNRATSEFVRTKADYTVAEFDAFVARNAQC